MNEMKAANGETSNQRMARKCKTAMNSINPDLVFTTESQEDFPNERLPTLDFEMWINNNHIRQKSMKTPFTILERSGMSYQQKFQILSNELVRRMSSIQIEKITHKEILEKIEQFIGELKNSEYSQKQAREIINRGLRGWKTKMRKRKRQNIPFYRVAHETVDQRLKKQLTERESWYKTREKNEEDEESPSKYRRTCASSSSSSRSWRTKLKQKGASKDDDAHPPIKSVTFVPHTWDSLLAKELKMKETEMLKITGEKVKVVEKAGNKLDDILTRRDPWKGADCVRENCFPCST